MSAEKQAGGKQFSPLCVCVCVCVCVCMHVCVCVCVPLSICAHVLVGECSTECFVCCIDDYSVSVPRLSVCGCA